jgi:fructose transport system permease protein
VAYVRLPPFIVTLGTLQIYFATNYLFSANETIRSQDVSAEAPILQFFGVKVNELFVRWYEGAQGLVWEGGRRPPATDSAWLDFIWSVKLPVGVIFMLLLTLIVAYVLRQTAWGRHVYAVGDDPEAAQLAGVNTRTTLISVYTVAGVICGFAGWASIGRNGSVSPTIGTDANLEAITAAVIGGISLFGGRGSVMGALFGALIVGVFSLGLRMVGANAQWTYLLIGLLIIVAVAIDQWIRKAAA